MKKYLKNSLSGIFQLLFSIALLFFSIPVFIHTYGLNAYGIFSVVSVFGNLTLLFNFGLNTALLKFISGNAAVQTKNRHVSVSLLIIGCITLLFSVILLLFQNAIVGGVFKSSPAYRDDIALSFKIFLLANFFIMLGQPFIAMIQAHSAYYITSLSQWIYNTLNWGGIILLCQLHVPFTYIAYPSLVSAAVWFALLLYFSVRKYGFRPAAFASRLQLFAYVKKQLSYSSQVYLISLICFCNEPLLRIFVVRYLGPQAAGSFDIVLKMKAQIVALYTRVFEPLTPLLASVRNKAQLRSIVHYTEQVAVFVVIPLCLCVYFFADPILHLWMKDISDALVINIKAAVIIFSLNFVLTPNYYYLTFHNRIRDCMRIQVVFTLSLHICFFAFKGVLGANTPVISICAGVVMGLMLTLYYQWKYLKSVIIDRYTLYSISGIAVLTGLYIAFIMWKMYVPVVIIIALVLAISAKYIVSLKRRGIHKLVQSNTLTA